MAGINHSYAPESGDFKVEAKHINSQSEGSLQYWASVLDHCDASVRIYKAPKGGRDVFALGRILVKSSHLHKTEDGQPTEVERDYSYADANEVQAIAIARRALRKELNHVRVPKINFAGKVTLLSQTAYLRLHYSLFRRSMAARCWSRKGSPARV